MFPKMDVKSIRCNLNSGYNSEKTSLKLLVVLFEGIKLDLLCTS